jgi:hypothetical protein
VGAAAVAQTGRRRVGRRSGKYGASALCHEGHGREGPGESERETSSNSKSDEQRGGSQGWAGQHDRRAAATASQATIGQRGGAGAMAGQCHVTAPSLRARVALLRAAVGAAARGSSFQQQGPLGEGSSGAPVLFMCEHTARAVMTRRSSRRVSIRLCHALSVP